MKPMPEAKWPPRAWLSERGERESEARGFYIEEGFVAPKYHGSVFVSQAEHTHLLAEAVREAKAEAFEDAVTYANLFFGNSEGQIRFLTKKAAELRKGATPENGGKKE